MRVLDVSVPMRDGVRLAADVVFVDDGQPRPVLLVRTPYSRQSIREAHDPVGYARAGWAVVLQDVRGRFDSGGEFAAFHQEVNDGADTITWCTQQPWSDGRVAMIGASYNGATQWLAATAQPPGLKAIAPVVSAGNFRDEWFLPGGVPELGFPAGWAFMIGASRPGLPAAQLRRMVRHAKDWPALMREPRARGAIGTSYPDYARWTDPGDDAYWRPIDVWRARPHVDLPAWHVGGWYDLFCEGTLNGYVHMTTSAPSAYARRSQRLIVGPWTHTTLYEQATPEMDFGIQANAAVAGFPAEMMTFLDDALADREVRAGVSLFVMGENRWREFDTWPVPVTATPLFLAASTTARGLAGDGRLDDAPPPRGRDSWLHDPDNPVPTRGGRTLLPVLPGPGPTDQRSVEERDDVLVYTGAPLRRGLRVIGMITADLVVGSTAEQADIAVKVCDVHPDGMSINIVDSVRRSDFTPGRPRRIKIEVGSTAHRFDRGHRIRIEVASSNYPRFAALPAAEQTILYGSSKPSVVTLPVA